MCYISRHLDFRREELSAKLAIQIRVAPTFLKIKKFSIITFDVDCLTKDKTVVEHLSQKRVSFECGPLCKTRIKAEEAFEEENGIDYEDDDEEDEAGELYVKYFKEVEFSDDWSFDVDVIRTTFYVEYDTGTDNAYFKKCNRIS